MTPPTVTVLGDLTSQVASRWRAVDPLLPAPEEPAAGCGARLAVTGPGGELAAFGVCEHWEGEPGSLDILLSPARKFRLGIWTAGENLAGALDELLTRWRDHLAGVPESRGEDTGALVVWPSRDVTGISALRRHGFAPQQVTVARLPRRGGPVPDLASAGPDPSETPVLIRRAGPGDVEAVAAWGVEVVRYDGQFGDWTERPWTARMLRDEAASALAHPEPWTWLAERDGQVIGLVHAKRRPGSPR